MRNCPGHKKLNFKCRWNIYLKAEEVVIPPSNVHLYIRFAVLGLHVLQKQELFIARYKLILAKTQQPHLLDINTQNNANIKMIQEHYKRVISNECPNPGTAGQQKQVEITEI